MKSKAQIKSHPLHPILVSFPIAFFTGSWLFDIAGWLLNLPELLLTSYWIQLAGICFSVIAAIPGLIDYLYAVPPDSTGKKRAGRHGVINVTMLTLFTITWFCRQEESISFAVIIVLDTVGIILLSIAGWMGGTLVYRNQIGVDHRYAHAGKWKEEHIDQVKGAIPVGNTDELKANQMKLLHVGELRIVLARTESSYAAFDDHCTHRGGGLSDGSLICGIVQCPWHGSQFDVSTGEVKAGPAKEKIKIYKISEREGKLYLEL